jgi:AraC-like DNA-binding protein
MEQLNERVSPLLVSSEMLLGCLEAAQDLGIDLDPILKEHGIESRLLKAPTGFLTHYQVINFLQAVARRFDCPHFALLVGKHQPPLSFGLLTQLLRLSPNLRTALEKGMLYESVYSQLVGHSLAVEDGYAQFTRWDRQTYPGSVVQLHTLGIVQLYKILRAICGSRWSATSVSFVHPKPGKLRHYQRFFKCPVDFNQEFDGIVFPERDLATPIATADTGLLDSLCNYFDTLMVDQPPKSDRVNWVYNYIRQKMSTNLCNLESCAQQLDIHPRALQRELSKHELTFKQLLSVTRMEVAERFLQSSPILLADLAEILGYRNRSAFSRAFKNSHGEYPGQWKESRELQVDVRTTLG